MPSTRPRKEQRRANARRCILPFKTEEPKPAPPGKGEIAAPARSLDLAVCSRAVRIKFGKRALRLAEGVAGAHDHDALLAQQADKDHDKKQTAYGSTPSRGQPEGGRGRHVARFIRKRRLHGFSRRCNWILCQGHCPFKSCQVRELGHTIFFDLAGTPRVARASSGRSRKHSIRSLEIGIVRCAPQDLNEREEMP